MVKPSTEFSRVFEKNSLRVAQQLLSEALEDPDGAKIKAKIQERLKFFLLDRV